MSLKMNETYQFSSNNNYKLIGAKRNVIFMPDEYSH